MPVNESEDAEVVQDDLPLEVMKDAASWISKHINILKTVPLASVFNNAMTTAYTNVRVMDVASSGIEQLLLLYQATQTYKDTDKVVKDLFKGKITYLAGMGSFNLMSTT